MSNISRKDLEENVSDVVVEILNLAGKLRVADERIAYLKGLVSDLECDVHFWKTSASFWKTKAEALAGEKL